MRVAESLGNGRRGVASHQRDVSRSVPYGPGRTNSLKCIPPQVRELRPEERARLFPVLDRHTQRTLEALLKYPPETAGGIMTTKFLTVPASATVEDTLQLIRRVGGAKETVYAIYVVDAEDGRLRHVVSLREQMLSERTRRVTEIGTRRQLLTVGPHTDREDVARLISKYDLLAVPVVDQDRESSAS